MERSGFLISVKPEALHRQAGTCARGDGVIRGLPAPSWVPRSAAVPAPLTRHTGEAGVQGPGQHAASCLQFALTGLCTQVTEGQPRAGSLQLSDEDAEALRGAVVGWLCPHPNP